MKKTFVVLYFGLISVAAFAQCNSFGWMLVHQKSISINERLCVYEKSDVRKSYIVDGFCPLSPPC